MPGLLTTTLLAGSATLAGGGALLLDRMALKVVRPPRRPHRRDPAEASAAGESLTLDGDVPLEVWWLRDGEPGARRSESGPVVVLVHGWGANAAVMLDLAEPLVASGHEVVLFDVRSHGRSGEAPWVTLGQFVADTERVLAHVRSRRPGSRIVLGGHSMGGAASVITAAGDPALAGVLLVAAPHDMYGVLTRYLTEHGMPGRAMVGALRPFWRPRLGRPTAQLDPGIRAREVRTAVLVVQPEDDTRVPPDNGVDLARDTGGHLLMVAGADHNDVLQRADVHQAVVEFVGAR